MSLFKCPRCGNALQELRAQDATYVVNGEPVCGFICYVAGTQENAGKEVVQSPQQH